MACILNGGELTLAGDVGGDYFGGDGFTYSDVVMVLAQIDDQSDLTVRLNSAGGIATEGAAIHALLARRAGKTDIIIDGMAVSAASLIAMAGDTVTMTMGAYMMIHDPSGWTMGTSADHAKSIEGLEVLATSYARVYAAKSGKAVDECREIMKAETWFGAEEAVDAGFADAADEAKASPATAFDYRVYAHAPKRLKALAAKKNWHLPDASAPAASAASTGRHEDPSMTDKERADQLAAELEALKATAKADADAVAAFKADKEDRERQDAILALPEAKGREATAKALASAPGMTVDSAKAVLVTAKADGETTSGETFETRRLNGEGLTGAGTQKTTASKAAGIIANYRAVTGAKASA